MSDTETIIDTSHNKLNTILEQFNTIYNSLTLFKMQISDIQQQIRTVEKNVKKELKSIKRDNKNDNPKNKRIPSGFAKPTKVTGELCKFMNRPEGTEIARTEVTKALSTYIKTNNLVEHSNNFKNKIVPDQKLMELLGLNHEELNGLTYFTLQKYMNKHFYSNKTTNLVV